MINKAAEHLCIPEGDYNVALPMTLEEADAKAKALYGLKAYTYDRLRAASVYYGAGNKYQGDQEFLNSERFGRYYVGEPSRPIGFIAGNGDSWGEAFAAAAKMAEVKL